MRTCGSFRSRPPTHQLDLEALDRVRDRPTARRSSADRPVFARFLVGSAAWCLPRARSGCGRRSPRRVLENASESLDPEDAEPGRERCGASGSDLEVQIVEMNGRSGADRLEAMTACIEDRARSRASARLVATAIDPLRSGTERPSRRDESSQPGLGRLPKQHRSPAARRGCLGSSKRGKLRYLRNDRDPWGSSRRTARSIARPDRDGSMDYVAREESTKERADRRYGEQAGADRLAGLRRDRTTALFQTTWLRSPFQPRPAKSSPPRSAPDE